MLQPGNSYQTVCWFSIGLTSLVSHLLRITFLYYLIYEVLKTILLYIFPSVLVLWGGGVIYLVPVTYLDWKYNRYYYLICGIIKFQDVIWCGSHSFTVLSTHYAPFTWKSYYSDLCFFSISYFFLLVMLYWSILIWFYNCYLFSHIFHLCSVV